MSETRPNILFIFTDQQQRDALGCMNNLQVYTPNLDRLAERGTLFTQAYSNCPICTPFRINLFTGRYSSQTGTRNNKGRIPEGERTFAAALNDGGYRTVYVSKWHIGGSGNGAIPRELLGDFEEFLGYQCYNGFWDDVRFWDEQGNEQAFDRHRTEVTTDLALEKMQDCAREPFTLFVGYQAPHYPVEPAPAYAEMYENQTISLRPNALEGVEPYTPTFSPPSPQPRENDTNYQRYGGDMKAYIRLYNAMVTQIDANVGRLLDKLDELGIADNTIVFFTSDHGDMQGSHGFINKVQPYEESAGIPLIVYCPGAPGGRRTDALVSGVDFMPTCLELAGLPDEPRAAGVSFAQTLRGEQQERTGPVFSEFQNWYMVREGRWKLVVEGQEYTPSMLFDLENDPYEMQNLVNVDDYAAEQAALRERVKNWHRDCIKEQAATSVKEGAE